MKKALSIVLALIMCLSLCACGSSNQPQPITLTTANIREYLSISAAVESCNIDEEKHSFLGITRTIYTGDARVKIQAVNQSGRNFKNVIIKCRISTTVDGMFEAPYGWEFTSGNQQTGTNPLTDENYKIITITLPYDGNWSDTESLSLEFYEASFGFVSPVKLSDCDIKIMEVTGTVE